MDILSAPGRHRCVLAGRDLRYALMTCLLAHGSLTITEVVRVLASLGFEVAGRPSKAVSDALRWEVACGRVLRLGRGTYGPGRIPPTTAWRARQRVRTLQHTQAAGVLGRSGVPDHHTAE